MTDTDVPFDLVVTGVTALTSDADRPVIDDAVIAIRGDTIASISTRAEASRLPARRTIDASGHVATPGFVNVHTHAILSFARGMSEDSGFAPAYTPGVPHAPDVTADESVALARLTALEAMLAGSTLINDMYVHADVTLPAMAGLGLRISASDWLFDIEFERLHDRVWHHDPKIGEERLRKAVDLYERYDGAFDGRASVMLAPHAPDTCSREYLRDVEIERRRLDTHVMTHVAQSRIEVARVRERDGMTPVEMLDDIGMLHERLLATHCVIMTDSDIERAGKAKVTVAHAPKVNMTGGFLPVTSRLRRAGVRMALGTDNMHGDIIEVMRWALISGRLQEQGITPEWSSSAVFGMATRGGAAAIGRAADLGMLKAGMKADVVLIDFRKPHLIPAFNPVGTLVHCGQGRDVNHVIVNGEVVVEVGRATKVDEDAIRRAGEAAARQLWTRVTSRPPEALRPGV